MGFATLSGPIRSGTVREGASRNTGLVVLAQAFNSGDLTGATVANYDPTTNIILPRGAIITDIIVDQTTAAATGTTTVSVGTTSGGAELMAAVATTAGGRFRGVATAATQLAWQLSTTADVPIFIRYAVGTATLTAGRFNVLITYVQRAGDGTYNPTSA